MGLEQFLGASAYDQRDFDFAKKYNLEIKLLLGQIMKMKIIKSQKKLMMVMVY